MSHILGLCCCKSCKDCRKGPRVRLPSCLGGAERGEEEQQRQQQQGAVTQEPSSSFSGDTFPSDSAAASAAGHKPKDSSNDADASSTISNASCTSKDAIFAAVMGSMRPPTDSPQPGPSGMATVSIDMVKNPLYTTSEDSETPP